MNAANWLIVTGIALGSILLEVCFVPLRGYSLSLSGFVSLFAYGLYTYYCLYSIHCRIEKEMESCRTGADILREEGYSFPCLSADINDPMLKEIGINVFPTVLIIDPDGDMVFRGDIEHAGKYLRKLAEP